jgi:metal-sulfur cluster biosynthetic enzyme
LLHDVIDPEVGLNIMDLGLVRDIKVDDGSGFVYITMTLTTPSCPLGPYIEDDINRTLGQVAWVTGVDVRLVWDPLWDPMRDMTDAGKDAMGWN